MVYYKMKAILLLTLSAIILSQSYGFAYADHGGNHYTGGEVGTITVGTDSSSYEAGEMIKSQVLSLIMTSRIHGAKILM